MQYRDRFEAWLSYLGLDQASREELQALTDEKEIEDRFYTELEFGTAGLRGVIGAGLNRMNVYVVRRATQGFANYICSLGQACVSRGIAIAYDSRNHSAEFAKEAALVLCANGIPVYLYESLRSVPQLSFTILTLNCIAGIVITASHNPPQYNGYKVYGENGGQLPPGPSEQVTQAITALSMFEAKTMSEQEALNKGLLRYIGEELDAQYDACVRSVCLQPDILKTADIKVVYTPLHGAGCLPIKRALFGLGFQYLYTVKEQEVPDGNFPTIKVPNPEDGNAYALAFALAKKVGATMVLATDPDSDRLGVAVADSEGGFQLLTGNQIGCLLLEYILSQRSRNKTLPPHGFIVKSIVSTSLVDVIATAYGVETDDVLTGFRYISDKIYESLQDGTRQFLFGFEESYGFLNHTQGRDKDGISAAVMLVEIAAFYAKTGKTLIHALEDIYRRYGYYDEAVLSYSLAGKEGLEKIQATMARLRENPPARWGNLSVRAVRDYQTGMRRDKAGKETPIPLPASNVLYYELENSNWLAIRPSGTEPKLKAYIAIRGNTRWDTQKLLGDMEAAVRIRLDEYLK
ncbi:MAG: phospho-sugar mutase [Christensenellales bacterium]|jgi:phosphoglucomutase